MRLTHLSQIVLISLLTVAGCRVPDTPVNARAYADHWSKVPYPDLAPHGPDLDIVIERDGTSLAVTNRTVTHFRDVQLWINQQYVQPVIELPIGRTPVFDLTYFVNRHGETFPVGGLLTPELAEPVLLVELYHAPDHDMLAATAPTDRRSGTRHRLLVRSPK